MGATISEVLAGRKSATVATLTVEGKQYPVALRPDTSEIGTYSVVITGPKGSQSVRMMYPGRKPLAEAMAHLEDYLNTDTPTRHTVTMKPLTAPSQQLPTRVPSEPVKPLTPIDHMRQELARLEAIRYKTAANEHVIKLLKARIAADPKKYRIGQGVGFKVAGGGGRTQISRGFRIIRILPDTHEAVIRQVADTGLTATGGDYDRFEDMVVPLSDLVTHRKYDVGSGQGRGVARQAPRAPKSETYEQGRLFNPRKRISGQLPLFPGYQVAPPTETIAPSGSTTAPWQKPAPRDLFLGDLPAELRRSVLEAADKLQARLGPGVWLSRTLPEDDIAYWRGESIHVLQDDSRERAKGNRSLLSQERVAEIIRELAYYEVLNRQRERMPQYATTNPSHQHPPCPVCRTGVAVNRGARVVECHRCGSLLGVR